MKYLRFNHQRAAEDFTKVLTNVSNDLIQEFHNESKKYLSQKAKADIEVHNAEYDESDKMIEAYVLFKGHALLESFGKGSKMDMTSEYLEDYMGSSLWNPLRPDQTIVGRAEGDYIDFFGNKRHSDGKSAGVPIENRVKPRKPSYSIQNAEKWLLEENGMIERRISLEIEEFVSKMHKYFEYR